MDAVSSVATENQNPVEPTTASDVKEERILARRKRVQIKIEADRRAALGEEPQEVRRDSKAHTVLCVLWRNYSVLCTLMLHRRLNM